MYTPPHFKVDDPAAMQRFVRQHAFATLISGGPAGPCVSHLPLTLDADRGPHGVLRGHLAAANPHHKYFAADHDSVAVFHGPHAYISPHDYTGQDPVVPTWNYAAVHAHGKPRKLEPHELVEHLKQLTTAYESGSDRPWAYDPQSEMIQRLHQAIVGFEMPITRLEGKFKLSQNRSEADRARMLIQLQAGPPEAQALADFIRDWGDPPAKG